MTEKSTHRSQRSNFISALKSDQKRGNSEALWATLPFFLFGTKSHKTAFKENTVFSCWQILVNCYEAATSPYEFNPFQVTGQKHIQPLRSRGLGEQKVRSSSQATGKCWPQKCCPVTNGHPVWNHGRLTSPFPFTAQIQGSVAAMRGGSGMDMRGKIRVEIHKMKWEQGECKKSDKGRKKETN